MQRLGDLETEIMERLWSLRNGALSVRDVMNDVRRKRKIAYTTVMTVLDNLHRKGLVRRAKQGRAYSYWPSQSREEYTAALMEEILHSSENQGSTLLHFVQQMSPEQVVGLRDVLDQLPDSERAP